MNLSELIRAVATQLDMHLTDTEAVIKKMGEVVTTELVEGGEVTLPGLGKLSVTRRAERQGRNPQTGESITIAAKNAPVFSASKALKDALN